MEKGRKKKLPLGILSGGIVTFILGFALGYTIGFDQAIDIGINLMTEFTEINVDPHVLEQLILKYGNR